MAIYKEDLVKIDLANGTIYRSFLTHMIGSGDNVANRFGMKTYRNGVPEDLSGASCQAVFMNAAGVNIALTSHGTVSGNVAYVTLPQACYNVEGPFCLAIKLTKSGVTVTSRIVDGIVCNTGTNGAVAPVASVPTYQEIIDQYAAMVSATSAANLAIAETFDATTAYPAGKYVINEGALYRLTAAHAANVTWADTSKAAAKLGDEVTKMMINTAPAFDAASTYAMGQYVLYEGKLYRFTDNHTGGWNIYDVVETSMSAELQRQLGIVEGILDVDEQQKNLNKVVYTSRETNGITFTVQDDNSVQVTGTTPAGTNAYLLTASTSVNNRFYLPAGTYTLSGGGIRDKVYPYLMFFNNQTDTSTARDNVAAFRGFQTFTTTQGYYCTVSIIVYENTTVDMRIYPQVEAGNKVTDYVSPFSIQYHSHELDRVSVIESEIGITEGPSKNKNSSPYEDRTFGTIDFIVNDDNSVSIYGTPNSSNAFLYGGDWPLGKRFLLTPGTYTLSGGISIQKYIYIYLCESQEATTFYETYYDYGDGVTFVVTQNSYCTCQICVLANTTFEEGETFYWQVESGSRKTRFMSPFQTVYASRLEEIDSEMAEMEDQINNVGLLPLPAYYHTGEYIENKCELINSMARASTGVTDTFAFVTDTHWTQNARQSPALLSYIKAHTRVEKLFHGGDVCDYITSEHQPYDAFSEFLKAWNDPIYTAMGNHDYASQYGTEARLYYAYSSKGRDRIGNQDRNYFYVDNPQSKIRYIFINGFAPGNSTWAWGFEQTQLDWLAGTALNLAAGWGAVVVTHITHSNVNGTPAVNANAQGLLNVLDAYSGAGEIIAVLSGHTHVDWIDRTAGGIPILVTTCDKNEPWGTSEPWLADRVTGTIREQVIEVYIIDRGAKTITRVRVGCPIHYGTDPNAWTDYEYVTTSYART